MKKYQIFISSTYNDLKEARAGVIETILQLGHIPIGMEAFVATSRKQMGLIEGAIDLSDYYILIIKERYGSIYKNGVSFTKAEYNYAKSKGMPILAFIHNKAKSTENRNLKKFVDEILKNESMAMFWEDENELARNVSTSLGGENGEFKNNPQIGWIRGDSKIFLDPITQAIKESCDILGIKNIYITPQDQNPWNDIASASEFFSIVYAGDKFVETYRVALEKAFENGAMISLLVGKENSDFFKDIERTEDVEMNQRITAMRREYRKIKKKFPLAKGKIEIRTFSTEFRNTLSIYRDRFGNFKSQLIVMFPHRSASHSPMFEIQGGINDELCMGYFKTVWHLHANDVIYDSDLDN